MSSCSCGHGIHVREITAVCLCSSPGVAVWALRASYGQIHKGLISMALNELTRGALCQAAQAKEKAQGWQLFPEPFLALGKF